MRTPGAVPNLCKADSGLSAMIGILVAISSHLRLVARYENTFLYLLLSNSAPIVRAQDKGPRTFGPPTLPWLFWRGDRDAWSGPGGPGVGARCGNGLFPLINLPNFILASLS